MSNLSNIQSFKNIEKIRKNCKSREHGSCIRCKIPFMKKEVKPLSDLINYRNVFLEQKNRIIGL